MGRTRTKKNIANKAADAKVQQNPSIPSLFEKARSLIIQCDYDLALRFIRRILEQQPASAEAKEMLGVAFLETGEIAAAKEVGVVLINQIIDLCVLQAFSSLLPPNPDAPSPPPPSAHLYLAQLSEDDPRLALQHYQAAIDLLSVQLKGKDRATNDNEKTDEAELKNSIVRALVGQVEIWMDPSYDLWYDYHHSCNPCN